jgi:hypothetical protein
MSICNSLIGSIVLYNEPSVESGIVEEIDENELLTEEASFFQTIDGIDWHVTQSRASHNHSINGYILNTALDEEGNITSGTPIYQSPSEDASILDYMHSGDNCIIHASSDWLEVTVEKASRPLYFFQSKNYDSDTDKEYLPLKKRIDFSILPETQENPIDSENQESFLPILIFENNVGNASTPNPDLTVHSESDSEATEAPSIDPAIIMETNEAVKQDLPEADSNDKSMGMHWVEDEIKDQNVLIVQDKHLKFKFAKSTPAPVVKPEPKVSLPLCYLEGTLKSNPGGPFSAFKKLAAPYFLCTADGKVIAYAKPENESVKAALNRACTQTVTLEGTCKLVDPKKPVLIEVQKVHFKSQL